GIVHDLGSMSAAYTTASLTGLRPRGVYAHGRQLLVERTDGTFTPWPHTVRCDHQQDTEAVTDNAAGDAAGARASGLGEGEQDRLCGCVSQNGIAQGD
ncbi:hypothetical protein ABZZ80_31980, partial [Streptomyces sp. NPDC006356]